jgi:hypothetical protein
MQTKAKHRHWGRLAVPLLLASGASHAQGTSTLHPVAADIVQVCTQPATQGQHWTITGNANGGVGVQINSLPSAAGSATFTGEEWSGIQQVLASDQVGDNESYRRCVEQITPLFLEKVPAARNDPADVGRALRAFLASNNLAVPGASYSDAQLMSLGANLMPNGVNLSYPTLLSGNYRALYAQDGSSPIGSTSRIFVEQKGVLLGVMIVQTCAANATVVCANNYADWKSALQSIVGTLADWKESLTVTTSGPFANGGGTLTKSIAFDDPWRVYIHRIDPPSGGGPTSVVLIVASVPQYP